jgi:hypothetical protein
MIDSRPCGPARAMRGVLERFAVLVFVLVPSNSLSSAGCRRGPMIPITKRAGAGSGHPARVLSPFGERDISLLRSISEPADRESEIKFYHQGERVLWEAVKSMSTSRPGRIGPCGRRLECASVAGQGAPISSRRAGRADATFTGVEDATLRLPTV